MKCCYCSAQLPENSPFCMCCGTKQEITARVQPEKCELDLEQIRTTASAGAPKKVRNEIPEIRTFTPPRLQLPTGRGLGKMIFLGILTLGIYPTVIWSRIVTELNLAASRYDGKRTMPYFAMCMLAPVTCGIYPLVWFHTFCNRVGGELERRGLGCRFGARTFWLWCVLGSLILVGPFVFTLKLMKAMNRINEDFNHCG